MVTKASILTYYKQGLKIIVETITSYYINSEVIYHLGEKEIIHFVIFFSKNLNSAECNYEIFDKELLTIIRCFE